jgi:hypothetical protein
MLPRPSSLFVRRNGRGPTGVSQERYEFTLIQQCFGYIFHNLFSWRFSFAVVDMGVQKGRKAYAVLHVLAWKVSCFPFQ